MNNTTTTSSLIYRVIGLLLLISLVLVVLTAAGRLTISWWAATVPLWAPWALAVVVCLVYLAIRLLMLTVRR